MSFSLDTPSIASLKAEARVMRDEHAARGTPMTQSAALEQVARAHGYRDWNTARASLPERYGTPADVGGRVTGTYLGQTFAGIVLGLQLLPDMRHYRITVKFDEPVDVVTSELFSAFRQRVTAVVDLRGISLTTTSNGEPHMRVRRA